MLLSHMQQQQQVLIAAHTQIYTIYSNSYENVQWPQLVFELINGYRHLFSFVDDNEAATAAVLFCGDRFFTCFKFAASMCFSFSKKQLIETNR